MGDGLRTIRVLTSDESLLASARAAASALEGFELDNPRTMEELLARPPAPGDVLLIDGALHERNAYEACRQLAGKTRCRTFVVVDAGNRLADGIAHFCGATGAIERPLSAAVLRGALERTGAARHEPPQSARAKEPKAAAFPAELLRDLSGRIDQGVVSALTDPETGLFNYAYLCYRLDEEFKRATRFGQPLACAMLGFDGEADERTLRELAGIFLSASRDTDLLGRFDASSFLFVLPSTGPDGAEVMAKRVESEADKARLRDVVGDPLKLAIGIASVPHVAVKKREDLFARVRKAFRDAQQTGGGVVTAA
jgi:diguanylate cyclase (GGDEF)-like protein